MKLSNIHSNTTTYIAFIVTIVSLLSISLYNTGQLIKADYEAYQSESACVRTYIAQGIERKDISTANGTCQIEY